MKSYDTLDEIREQLIPLGFKEFKPSRFDSDGVITCFQKRYDHKKYGKMFFIDAKIYDFSFTDIVKENYTISFSCQLYALGTHDAMNIDFIDWDLENIETFIRRLFECGFLEPYEQWEES